MVRVGALFRVSSSKQAKAQRRDDEDMPGQRAAVRRFLEEHPDWSLVKEFEEPGVSAFKKRYEERPVLLEVLSWAEQGKLDALCVFKEDRISRGDEEDNSELIYLLKRFEKAGVQVWSVADNKHLTVKGIQLAMRSIEAVGANEYSKRISVGVKNGNRTGAEAGRWHGGRTPLGYILETKMGDDGRTVVRSGRVVNEIKPHPLYASVVQALYERYLAGQGTPALAAWLNTTGTPSFSGKGWDANGVKHILCNRFYLGEIGWHQSGRAGDDAAPFYSKGHHEPIVDAATFDQVQQRMAARTRIPARQRGASYVLAGLIYCSCGAKLGGITRTKETRTKGTWERQHYRCRAWVMQGVCPEGTKHLLAETVEANFLEALATLHQPTKIRRLLEQEFQHNEGRLRQDQDARKQAQDQLRKVTGALERLDKAFFEDGVVTPAEYKEKKDRYVTQQQELAAQLEAPRATAEIADMTKLSLMVTQMREIWAEADKEERKALAMDLLTGFKLRAVVHPDARVEFRRENAV